MNYAAATSYLSVDWQNAINWSHPLNRHLQHWWLTPWHMAGGTVLHDIAGEYDGELQLMAPASDWIVGPSGFAALAFDGVNDVVDFGTVGDLGSSMESYGLTTSCWLRWSHANAWESYAGGRSAGGQDISLFVNRRGDNLASSAGDIAFYFDDEAAVALSGGTVGKSFNDGAWHYVTIAVQPNVSGTSSIQMYVDGIAQSLSFGNTGNPNMSVNWADFGIGARILNGTPSKWYEGDIADFRFDQGVVSARHAYELYAAAKQGYAPLLRYWRPRVGIATAVADDNFRSRTIRIPGPVQYYGLHRMSA